MKNRYAPVTVVPLLAAAAAARSAGAAPPISAPAVSQSPISCALQPPPVSPGSDGSASLHLGLGVAPVLAFSGGLDVTLTRFHLIRPLLTRFDAGAIISFKAPSFIGLPGSTIYATVDQIYPFAGRGKLYAGVGGGYLFQTDHSGAGAKLFVGDWFSRFVGAEASLYLLSAKPLVTIDLRIAL